MALIVHVLTLHRSMMYASNLWFDFNFGGPDGGSELSDELVVSW